MLKTVLRPPSYSFHEKALLCRPIIREFSEISKIVSGHISETDKAKINAAKYIGILAENICNENIKERGKKIYWPDKSTLT